MDILSIKNLTQTMSAYGNSDAKSTSTKDAKADFSAMFSSFSMNFVSNVNKPSMEKVDAIKGFAPNSGFEKLNIKNADVNGNVSADAAQTNAELAKEMKAFKEEVVSAVSEACGVDEDAVEEAMEELGIAISQLMNPQTLAELVSALTGTEDVMELLLSGDFSDLMDEITNFVAELAENISVDKDLIPGMLEQFDFEATEEMSFDTAFETAMQPEENVENLSNVMETTGYMEEADGVAKKADEGTEKAEESGVLFEEDEDVAELPTDAPKADAFASSEKKDDTKTFVKDERNSSGSENEHTPLFAQQSEQPVSNANTVMNNISSYVSSYTNVNPVEILEQITSNLKVTLANDATTMEMQLNPENLGKVFLQVSAKEGVVSAQITAQNEVVKEVLETQMADLRENLNQQGVKVDAIEVTVSSHAFERNLDQNQHREEKEGEMQEANKPVRRNLRMDSLDELIGLMSEEEMLAAQIMRDNGNSMDLTA